MTASIYPITQIYFRCDKCGVEWMIRPAPAISGIDDLKRFTEQGRMGPCPKSCGGRSCSMIFKPHGTPGVDDPFSLFDGESP